jgi:hypothetical protein
MIGTVTQFKTSPRGYVVTCVSTVLDRLTHFQGTAGNYAEPMTEAVMTPEGRRDVPLLSGNALKHLVREQAADVMCEAMGVPDNSLDPFLVAYLHNGGVMDRGGGRVNVRRRMELRRVAPLLAMLGGNFRDDMVPATIKVDAGMLICRENADRLRRKFPDVADWEGTDLAPQQEMRADFNYYSKVGPFPGEQRISLEALEALEDKPKKKLFSPAPIGGGYIAAGSVFVHAYRLDQPDPVHLGGLLYCLRRWAERVGTIGAMSARGHGRLDMRTTLPDGVDGDACVLQFLDHLAGHAAEARNFLYREFSTATPAAPADGGTAKAPNRRRKPDAREATVPETDGDAG